MTQRILLRDLDILDIGQLDVYVKHSGYAALQKALPSMKPDDVTEVVKASGLRGRGAPAFPPASIGLALIVTIFKTKKSINVDDISLMKG